jgi:mono/diheme cytochrome c family protein
MAKYDAACALCHAAGSHDMTTALNGNDLKGRQNNIVSNLGSINAVMGSLAPLTAQEILDLKAFLGQPNL